MSTLAASNLEESPPKLNQPPTPSSLPSLFFSLPDDIVLDILARVPKRYYPILSCVSKKFQVLVRSREIHKTRSLLGKDSLYLWFIDECDKTHNWFTFRGIEKNPTKNHHLVSIDFPFIPKTGYDPSSIIAVGPEIFFIHGSNGFIPSSSLWIFDSQSGKCRQGPSMQVELSFRSVGLVGGKIYVFGCDEKNKFQAELFDLKTQTWKPARNPRGQNHSKWMSKGHHVALDREICAVLSSSMACYDTRSGVCKKFEFAKRPWCSKGACVIDNVLYVYYNEGLRWYNSRLKEWKMVNGLDHLNKISPVGMAEYYGKLAYMWEESDGVVVSSEIVDGLDRFNMIGPFGMLQYYGKLAYMRRKRGGVFDGSETKEIWCTMIALDKNKVGIHGTAEPSQLLGIVPRRYSLHKCLSLSD